LQILSHIYICASALITCTIIMSCSLHCCHATLLSRLRQFRWLLCVATMSSLVQLQVRNGYRKAEATRRDGARLTESGNTRSEQLLVVPTESLTNRQRLLGELLSGSEHRRPGWFLDMKYQDLLLPVPILLKSQFCVLRVSLSCMSCCKVDNSLNCCLWS